MMSRKYLQLSCCSKNRKSITEKGLPPRKQSTMYVNNNKNNNKNNNNNNNNNNVVLDTTENSMLPPELTVKYAHDLSLIHI